MLVTEQGLQLKGIVSETALDSKTPTAYSATKNE